MQVESRSLRYFVAVAEELSFTRAAERLDLASPALSRAVAQLETQLGVTLLKRTTRKVTLTEAGDVLLEEARVTLTALERAVRRTQRAAGSRRRLVVALKADVDGGLLERTIEAYEHEATAVPLEVLLCAWGEEPQLLRDGHADVALLRTPFDEHDLDFDIVTQEEQVLVLSAAHDLAAHDLVRREELERDYEPTPDPNVWRLRGGSGGTEAALLTDDLAQLLKMVQFGQIAMLLAASDALRTARPGLVRRPMPGAAKAALAIAWPQRSHSVPAATFVRSLVDVAAKDPDAPVVTPKVRRAYTSG